MVDIFFGDMKYEGWRPPPQEIFGRGPTSSTFIRAQGPPTKLLRARVALLTFYSCRLQNVSTYLRHPNPYITLLTPNPDSEDSIFKSSGHITGASGFAPKTWPGKVLLMSWTWRSSRLVGRRLTGKKANCS